MIVLKKIGLLLCLIGMIAGGCTSDPKPPPLPPTTVPMERLSGSWEVSHAERNGRNTGTLEGIYFTFTEDKKLISNFNLSLEERTVPYQMRGDTLVALSTPEQPYLIQSLTETGIVLRTKMEGYLFKLVLKTKEEPPLNEDTEES